MDQDTLRFLLREAVRETVTEVPQTVLEEMLQAVEAFRRRPLPEEMASVYLDGLYQASPGRGGSWATGSCRRRAPWGAGQRPDPLGGRPEAGVRGGEPGGGS